MVRVTCEVAIVKKFAFLKMLSYVCNDDMWVYLCVIRCQIIV